MSCPRMGVAGRLAAALIGLLGAQAALAQALPPTRVQAPDDAEMVLVPDGPFVYGMDAAATRALLRQIKAGWAEIYDHELKRQVRSDVAAFYIDRFEVSNARYNAFVKATRQARPSRFASYPQLNDPRQPVTGVGWPDAQAYCAWAGKRLPTEVEWEKAARGNDGRPWPWGSKPNTRGYNGRYTGFMAPMPVGSMRASDSPYGVADMAGNVWEMTASSWPDGRMVMRGGSYLNKLGDVRVTVRWAASDEAQGANWLGFRCAMDAPPLTPAPPLQRQAQPK